MKFLHKHDHKRYPTSLMVQETEEMDIRVGKYVDSFQFHLYVLFSHVLFDVSDVLWESSVKYMYSHFSVLLNAMGLNTLLFSI